MRDGQLIPITPSSPPAHGGQPSLQSLPVLPLGSREKIELDEPSVLVSCVHCGAPVSVRLWNMVADCWRCDVPLELSIEQRRQFEKLAESGNKPRGDLAVPPPRNLAAIDVVPGPTPALPVVIETDAVDRPRSRIESPDFESRWSARAARSAFDAMPAWLVSFILHLILLLLLALVLLPQPSEKLEIVLSMSLAKEHTEGEFLTINMPEENDAYQLAKKMAPGDEQAARLIRQSEELAGELTEEPPGGASRGDLGQLKKELANTSGSSAAHAARDPRLRTEIVKQQGGTTLTEAAVARGLRWLASVQNHDGSWSLKNYSRHNLARNRGDMAATSLALLPFLGAGQTHENGKYRETVTQGILWILQHQGDDGDLRDLASTRAGRTEAISAMYAHGQASIVLIEAFSMTGDERLREPAQKAIDFIVKAQHRDGGWRYTPGQSGDTSVSGWQIMALESARRSQSGLQVDRATLDLADQYLDRASGPFADYPHGSLYRYQPDGGRPTATMTAEGLLCRMYLGWRNDSAKLTLGLDYLIENHLPRKRTASLYYWYYATQVMHHAGGKRWEMWNERMRDLLVQMQQRSGKHIGSWEPRDFEFGPRGGRIYTTSLAICTLEVYYRHLPLFAPIEIE